MERGVLTGAGDRHLEGMWEIVTVGTGRFNKEKITGRFVINNLKQSVRIKKENSLATFTVTLVSCSWET